METPKATITDRVVAYHHKGLTQKEIAKLLDLTPRTVQRYMKAAQCREATQTKTREQKALEMHTRGMSYAEIAKRLRVCKATVYLWHRKAKGATSAA